MNTVFQMIAFNADHFLEPCLEAILPYADKVVVTEGPVEYWQGRGYTTSADLTNEILADLVGEENVVHGRWTEKKQMMNAVLHLIPDDTDYVWLVDADEIWPSWTIDGVQKYLEAHRPDSMSFRAHSFYGGFKHVITGFEEAFEVHRIKRWYPGARWLTHRPPSIYLEDKSALMRYGNHVDHIETGLYDWRFYHYSYVYPEQMRAKAAYYRAMRGVGCIPNYYERVYLPWVAGNIAQRAAIEREYKGVHDWTPSTRGPAYTRPWEGQHPEPIRCRMHALDARLHGELQAEMCR